MHSFTHLHKRYTFEVIYVYFESPSTWVLALMGKVCCHAKICKNSNCCEISKISHNEEEDMVFSINILSFMSSKTQYSLNTCSEN